MKVYLYKTFSLLLHYFDHNMDAQLCTAAMDTFRLSAAMDTFRLSAVECRYENWKTTAATGV